MSAGPLAEQLEQTVICTTCKQRWIRFPALHKIGCPDGHGGITDLEMLAEPHLRLLGELVR